MDKQSFSTSKRSFSASKIPYPTITSPDDLTKNFKDRVIDVVRAIPYGKVTNYGTIATMAGVPRGARLVGGVLHYNATSLGLPWYRVINRHGFISTRCEDHTRDEQKELLEKEGIEVSEDFMVNLDKYGWWG